MNAFHELMDRISAPKAETVIKHGNAITPYREVEREKFNTQIAAVLYGSMQCKQLDQYHYWMTAPA